MTKSELMENLTDEILEKKCFCEHKCPFVGVDYDTYVDSDGMENDEYSWSCNACSGEYCPLTGKFIHQD